MVPCLYDQLIKVNHVRAGFELPGENFESMLPHIQSLYGFNERYIHGEEIDWADFKRDLMDNYEDNEFFLGHVNKKISISGSLYGLASVNFHGKGFFPRFKNNEHNQRVEQMESLIGSLPSLKSNGVFAMDNLVGAGLISGGIIYAVTNFAVPYLVESTCLDSECIRPAIDALSSLGFAFGAGVVCGTLAQDRRDCKIPVLEAIILGRELDEFWIK